MRPSILDPLFAPITSLEGVGPKVAGMIERIVPADLGDRAARAGDLLFTLPTSVIDRRDRPGIANAAPGAIVTVGSINAYCGLSNLTVYSMSKGALMTMTRNLANTLGPERIRVNCMVPGWVMTERQMRLWLTPAGERQIEERQCLPDRLQPSDIARMALFLGADDSRMCTSQQFIVDGGWV